MLALHVSMSSRCGEFPYQINALHDLHEFLAVMSENVSNYLSRNSAIIGTESFTNLWEACQLSR
jgi:hypothetical protein